jgi:hypothetical protein
MEEKLDNQRGAALAIQDETENGEPHGRGEEEEECEESSGDQLAVWAGDGSLFPRSSLGGRVCVCAGVRVCVRSRDAFSPNTVRSCLFSSWRG